MSDSKKSHENPKNLVSISDLMKKIPESIRPVLAKNMEERYLESILLIYSMIENATKWLLLQKLIWDKVKSTKNIEPIDLRYLINYVNKQSHEYRLDFAYSINLYPIKLYEELLKIKGERNNIIHQLWMFEHRTDYAVLRAKLDTVIRISNEIATMMVSLCEEMGPTNCTYFQFNEHGNLDAEGLMKLRHYKRKMK